MTIKEVIALYDNYSINQIKLSAVKLVNDIRGGGLRESKDITDKFFTPGFAEGESLIRYLKSTNEWSNIKSKIRKLSKHNYKLHKE